ncbi:MAG: GNAT family N-acetyltransferase [Nitrospira sp.]|nr:GNAT family N-acetyltransferase [Nitrospira sp.]MCP9442653.1 GNAT family N-acetyltransferase [Nitrospira sp.]
MARETEGRQLDETRLRKGIHAVLSDPRRGSFIIAEAQERSRRRIVGQLMLTSEWSDWRNGMFLWVQSVYVDPAWRRQGIYRALYRHVLEKAKRDPTTCGIRLYVARDNRTARTVYRRVGLSTTRYIVYEQDFVLESQTNHRRG